MKQIALMLPDLRRFKIRAAKTLFEPSAKDIATAKKRGRCFLCGNKLVKMRTKELLYCRSRKHAPLVLRGWGYPQVGLAKP